MTWLAEPPLPLWHLRSTGQFKKCPVVSKVVVFFTVAACVRVNAFPREGGAPAFAHAGFGRGLGSQSESRGQIWEPHLSPAAATVVVGMGAEPVMTTLELRPVARRCWKKRCER